jgi:ribosomal protein S18 acetylase RimI-like enzyme
MLIQALTGAHNRADFDCGRNELNTWLQRVAAQHVNKGLSRTFVATITGTPAKICGYYALTLTELSSDELPLEARKVFPRRVPGIRLGRLAVDLMCQGKGLGELLLVNAIHRVEIVQAQAGAVGLFVDAIDDVAANFYLRYGFKPSPSNRLLLFLPVKA